MKHLIALGESGAERLGDFVRPDTKLTTAVDPFLTLINSELPSARIQVERDDGVKTMVEVKVLPLTSPMVFELVHRLAPYEPTVFVTQTDKPAVQGMLSAQYDKKGELRLPSLKVIPLNQPIPHGVHGLPDAGGVAMLGGAVSAERPGVGSHRGDVSKDLEHRATIIGAVSLRDPAIAITHASHDMREASSIATGLTDTTLGDLYTPGSIDGFYGYGEPIIVDPQTGKDTTLYILKSYLERPDLAFGSMLEVDPSRVMLGTGMKGLVQRGGSEEALQQQLLTVSRGVSASW